MSVTLKHIAEELNVSHATVANALNGKSCVKPATRLRVQETALRLGYDKNANRAAQALIAKRLGRRIANGAIALIQNAEGEFPWQSIPFYRTLLDGVEREARQLGVDLYVVMQHGSELPRAVKEHRVDGVIFMSGAQLFKDELRGLNLPFLTLGTYNPGMFSILPDGEDGFYQATEYLISLGHRHIAYVGGKSTLAVKRLDGYKRALVKHGLVVSENLIQYTDRKLVKRTDHTITQEHNLMELEGRAAMESLLERRRASSSKTRFTAVLCANDIIAIGAVRCAQAAGLRVPEDVSVVGFDDVSVQYSFQPLLTSVAFPGFDMGRRALEWLSNEVHSLLSEQIGSSVWEPQEKIEYFPTTISVRESTAPLKTSLASRDKN
jgi:DNA-binding LacI/PurR family transcriptional regulator